MEKFGEQRIQQNDYYPNDVRWYWSNKRIQVTEPEVAWMPQALFWLGIFTGRCTSGQPEVAKRERKKHAQGSVLNPGLSKWVCINSHPFHPGHYPGSSWEMKIAFWIQLNSETSKEDTVSLSWLLKRKVVPSSTIPDSYAWYKVASPANTFVKWLWW